MKKIQRMIFIAGLLLGPVILQHARACSGYKITIGHKTLVGSNEDAWRLTPHIWFEKAKANAMFGAAFTGSRFDGTNGYAPQSGMNEMGLAFERLASYHPRQQGFPNRKTITNPTQYLKDILHNCKSIDEVKAYISQYDHSFFIEDVFMYVDRSGQYLIAEPYTLTVGHEASYVISNFCPSITSAKQAGKLDRYRHGVAFLKQGADTTLAYCRALSDTMHVCRSKIGDGTLLSSVWDLNHGTVNLYFYHNYDSTVQFNLSEELKKEDHLIAIQTLFPHNNEFEQLGHFKTTKNSLPLGIGILLSGGFFLFTSVFFLIHYLRRRQRSQFAYLQLTLVPLGLMLCFYMYVLSGSVNVFYFPAPYHDPGSLLVSLSAYIPFLLLLLILPFALLNYRLIKGPGWGLAATALFTLNNLVYLMLIGLFAYWRFFDIFH
ncbi:MAG: hypothetical protein IT257_09045 [Chitinophagaceae bacterium]|nr:hypothetical protein [Chitinophagaceae bacterium]